jgi:putative transposase
MTKLAYVSNCHVEISGVSHVFQQELPGGHLMFVNAKTGAPCLYIDPDTGESRFPTNVDIETLLADGQFNPLFMAPAQNHLARGTIVDVDIEEIEKLDAEAKRRQWWVRAYDAAPCRLSDAKLERFIADNSSDAIEQGYEKMPHPSTLRRWTRFRGNLESRPLNAMINMSGRVPRRRGFDVRTENKITEELDRYWHKRETTVSEVIDNVQNYVDTHNEVAPDCDQLKKPSDETVRQRIRKSETSDLFRLKYGDKAFRIKYRTPQDRRLSATRILETAIVDHSVVDTMLVVSAQDRTPLGRPTIGLMIDVAARVILSNIVTFAHPSTHTVSQLLKRAVRPKPHLRARFPDFPDGAGVYGVPEAIVYDRALESNGVSHRDALADLAIEVIYAGAAEPQAKGIVERFFRTLNQLLFHRLKGSVHLPVSLMRELGYDPAKTAVLTLEELNELIEEAINVYHYQVHSGINAQPIRIWTEQAAKYGVRTLPDPSILDKMVGVTKHPCTLDRAGIRIFRLKYCCEKNVPILLNDMCAETRTARGKRKGSANAIVKIKYNPDDISVIHVFNSKDRKYYELRCTDMEYARGLGLSQHHEIRKFATSINNAFNTPEQRRAARMALRASIEAACPEIGLKAKRAQKLLRDALSSVAENDPAEIDFDVEVHNELPQMLACEGRNDLGVPQHSPQRGKSARKRTSKTTKTASAKAKPAIPAILLAISADLRATEEAGWDTLKGFQK